MELPNVGEEGEITQGFEIAASADLDGVNGGRMADTPADSTEQPVVSVVNVEATYAVQTFEERLDQAEIRDAVTAEASWG